LRWATKELTANLLRVAAGGGQPFGVIRHLAAVANAHAEFAPLFRHYRGQHPVAESLTQDWLRESLLPPAEADAERRWNLEEAVEGAEDEILKYALRIVAARLVSQNTVERIAHRRFYEALFRWSEAHEKRCAQ
jgi:hypothetical protein